MYYIEKNLTRLRNGQFTFFLDPKELNEVKSKLKKDEYFKNFKIFFNFFRQTDNHNICLL